MIQNTVFRVRVNMEKRIQSTPYSSPYTFIGRETTHKFVIRKGSIKKELSFQYPSIAITRVICMKLL